MNCPSLVLVSFVKRGLRRLPSHDYGEGPAASPLAKGDLAVHIVDCADDTVPFGWRHSHTCALAPASAGGPIAMTAQPQKYPHHGSALRLSGHVHTDFLWGHTFLA